MNIRDRFPGGLRFDAADADQPPKKIVYLTGRGCRVELAAANVKGLTFNGDLGAAIFCCTETLPFDRFVSSGRLPSAAPCIAARIPPDGLTAAV